MSNRAKRWLGSAPDVSISAAGGASLSAADLTALRPPARWSSLLGG
jgi:hypothetical protein